jgi:hypothetical protein
VASLITRAFRRSPGQDEMPPRPQQRRPPDAWSRPPGAWVSAGPYDPDRDPDFDPCGSEPLKTGKAPR